MNNIFSKDENILTAPPILGYKILYYMKKTKKVKQISIFDIADHFKKEPWFSSNNLYYALIFLFSIGAIDYAQPYIKVVSRK